MNNSTQAQKGFKTFLTTLIVSFFVFSGIYYVASSLDAKKEPMNVAQTAEVELAAKDTQENDVSGNSVSGNKVLGTSVAANEAESVFAMLAKSKVDTDQRAVLAGSDTSETTTPVVPDTGYVSITISVMLSLALFSLGMWMISKDPRKLALKAFENKLTRN